MLLTLSGYYRRETPDLGYNRTKIYFHICCGYLNFIYVCPKSISLAYSDFPVDLISPEKKDKSWLLQVARAIYWSSTNGLTLYGDAGRQYLATVKSYMDNSQSEAQYIEWLHNKRTIVKGCVELLLFPMRE